MRALLPLIVSIIPLAALGQLGENAARPGDESLTCDQLKAEMSGLGQQTDLRGIVQQQTAAGLGQANSERLANEAANQEAQAATPRNERQRAQRGSADSATDAPADAETEPAAEGDRRGGGFLRRAAGAGGGGGGGVFGAGVGRGRGAASDAAAAEAETEADPVADQAAALEQSLGAQPGLGRGFRLMELAQAKKCAFLDEGAPPRGRPAR